LISIQYGRKGVRCFLFHLPWIVKEKRKGNKEEWILGTDAPTGIEFSGFSSLHSSKLYPTVSNDGLHLMSQD
jgi:hypothetical protein